MTPGQLSVPGEERGPRQELPGARFEAYKCSYDILSCPGAS